MKSRTRLVGLCLLLSCQNSDGAEPALRWKDTQIQTFITGSIPLPITDVPAWSADGSLMHFWIPSTGLQQPFAQVGLGWAATPWLRIMPRLGFAGNWVQGKETAGIVALNASLSFFDRRWNTLLLNQAMLHPKQKDFFGFIWTDWRVTDWLGIGLQASTVNLNPKLGPHLGIRKGIWGHELQLFFDPLKNEMALRAVTNINF